MHLDHTGELVWPEPFKKSKFNLAVSPYSLLRYSKNYQGDNYGGTTYDIVTIFVWE
jgi:hypothetical protein